MKHSYYCHSDIIEAEIKTIPQVDSTGCFGSKVLERTKH